MQYVLIGFDYFYIRQNTVKNLISKFCQNGKIMVLILAQNYK